MPKLEWNGREISGWLWDGLELKPKFGANGRNTWVFNGRELKPKFGASSANVWVWDGLELKPKFGARSNNIWVIRNGKAKPKYGVEAETWEVGNAPIPIIAGAVALRLFKTQEG